MKCITIAAKLFGLASALASCTYGIVNVTA